jgi:hypothetical protein
VIEAGVRELVVELEELGAVVRADGPEVERRPVPENDVLFVARRVRKRRAGKPLPLLFGRRNPADDPARHPADDTAMRPALRREEESASAPEAERREMVVI